jgi:hypothetical protein
LLATQIGFVILDDPLHLKGDCASQFLAVFGRWRQTLFFEMAIDEPVAEAPLIESLSIRGRQWLGRIYIEWALVRTPKAGTDFDIPLQLLIGISLDLAPKVLADRSRMLRNIVGRQWALAVPQIGPAFLDFGELRRMQPLRLSGVSRAQTEALLALPEKVAQVIRNTLPEPVVAAVRMLPGSRHRKSHVYHPCVPIRAAKAYYNQ